MRLTQTEEDRLEELEAKQNLTEPEANELQELLDRYYDQHFDKQSTSKKGN